MELEKARAIAEDMIFSIRPFCQRAEIAGSIRRQKPEVKDIEIVAIPVWSEEPKAGSFFGETDLINELWRHLSARGDIQWIKPGTSKVIPWEIKPHGKYWRGLVQEDIKFDLFVVRPSNWGIQFALRTGSAEFSKALVTRAKEVGFPCVDGMLQRKADGYRIGTPEEADVFDLLGLTYIEPAERIGFESLRKIRRR